MAKDIDIKVTGAKELHSKMEQAPKVITDEITGATHKSGLVIEAEWKKLAPRKQGTYARSIHTNSPVKSSHSVSVQVGASVRPYPEILNTSPRYHYRSSGPIGSPTRGHVEDAIERAMPQIEQVFEAIGVKVAVRMR